MNISHEQDLEKLKKQATQQKNYVVVLNLTNDIISLPLTLKQADDLIQTHINDQIVS